MYGKPVNTPESFNEAVDYAVQQLEGVDFNMIVFRGFSGAVIAPTVAAKLGKMWALVRKPGDSAHSSRRVEGIVRGKYVIVDDFIDSGNTIRETVKAVGQQVVPAEPAKCVGVVLYDPEWWGKVRVRLRDVFEEKIGIGILNKD
jgi:adenine/guanine phosphoribosyltransferase-like PRPP-binding protein